MWLSQQLSAAGMECQTPAVQIGTVSVGGAAPAVQTDCEHRELAILAPGGFCWRPAPGDRVIVLRQGEGCVAGVRQALPEDLRAGEVRLFSKGCSITLTADGEIHLTGTVYLNGKKLE